MAPTNPRMTWAQLGPKMALNMAQAGLHNPQPSWHGSGFCQKYFIPESACEGFFVKKQPL